MYVAWASSPIPGTCGCPGCFVEPLYFRVVGEDNVDMMERVVKIRRIEDWAEAQREDLEYWLSRPPGERIAAVELIRREFHGDLPRLQRVIRVVQRGEG